MINRWIWLILFGLTASIAVFVYRSNTQAIVPTAPGKASRTTQNPNLNEPTSSDTEADGNTDPFRSTSRAKSSANADTESLPSSKGPLDDRDPVVPHNPIPAGKAKTPNPYANNGPANEFNEAPPSVAPPQHAPNYPPTNSPGAPTANTSPTDNNGLPPTNYGATPPPAAGYDPLLETPGQPGQGLTSPPPINPGANEANNSDYQRDQFANEQIMPPPPAQQNYEPLEADASMPAPMPPSYDDSGAPPPPPPPGYPTDDGSIPIAPEAGDY